jgi:hypothetical protein
VKSWGVTAVFDGRSVVVKHTSPVRYPHAGAIHRAVHRASPTRVTQEVVFECTPHRDPDIV